MVREVPQVDASELVKEYILLGVWLAQAGLAASASQADRNKNLPLNTVF